MFSPSEMGFNVCRTCIGASDYSRNVYSFDEGEPDPDLQRFSIDHDREYILPMLREARKANPDLFLFSPVESSGMDEAEQIDARREYERKYMPSYANYFVKFLQAYEAEGVPIQAVSIQNEVDTDQDGRMPACSWPQEYEADFVRQQLGPAFERTGIKTKIWIIDHNYNLWGRAMGELETPECARIYQCRRVAWLRGQSRVDRIACRAHIPASKCTGPKAAGLYWPDYMTDWTKWSETFTECLSPLVPIDHRVELGSR